jgi:hypothetical protein
VIHDSYQFFTIGYKKIGFYSKNQDQNDGKNGKEEKGIFDNFSGSYIQIFFEKEIKEESHSEAQPSAPGEAEQDG